MKTEAIGVVVLLALIIWLNRRQEYVTSTITTGPPATWDWWDYWYASGGS